jgi:hydrogenase maturation factor
LIRFVARVAPLLTLAHDVGDGGVEGALLEAARWSGVGAEVDVPEHARIVLACPQDRVGRLGERFREIGVVGGATILGRAVV